MKEQKLKELKLSKADRSLPGFVMAEAHVKVVTSVSVGGPDDATLLFCDGRWFRPPVSEVVEWWKRLPVCWPQIIPEYQSKERGMTNRIPRDTWAGAHDRARFWELRHWSSANAHAYKR